MGSAVAAVTKRTVERSVVDGAMRSALLLRAGGVRTDNSGGGLNGVLGALVGAKSGSVLPFALPPLVTRSPKVEAFAGLIHVHSHGIQFT